jgi:acyl dehydratase
MVRRGARHGLETMCIGGGQGLAAGVQARLMVRTFTSFEAVGADVGQNLGASPWLEVDQHRIDLFGQATGDHQWIHVDPVRAEAGPSGAIIAHG